MVDHPDRVESERAPIATTVELERVDGKPLDYFPVHDADVLADEELKNIVNAGTGGPAIVKKQIGEEHLHAINKYLSKAGVADADLKSADANWATLAPNIKVVESAEKQVKELEKAVLGPGIFAVKDAAGAVRAAEIRTFCAKCDRSKLNSMLHDAVKDFESGDEEHFELLAAVCDAPKSMNLVPVEIKNAITAAVAARRHPEKIAALNRLRRATETARWSLDRAREILYRNVPTTMRSRVEAK